MAIDVSWLSDWDQAAEHPWRTLICLILSGLVIGGLIGYFRFDHSAGYGVVIGLSFASIFGVMGWKDMHDPERVAQRRQPSRAALRIAAIRLAIPFGALAIATIAGAATGSLNVFAISLVACLVAGFFLSRSRSA
jgi:hypothetical protein